MFAGGGHCERGGADRNRCGSVSSPPSLAKHEPPSVSPVERDRFAPGGVSGMLVIS